MAKLHLPYGKDEICVTVPDGQLNGVLEPAPVSLDCISEETLVQRALENPIDSPRLCELVRGKQQIVIISSDHTRPLPSRITMPLLLQEIRLGNPKADITILVATGMHRPTTEAELRAKYGDRIVDEEKIAVHRATDEDNMMFFGILPSGGELWLNGLIAQADLVVAEGLIEPHFFAGFSGGRKSILPGVASYKTILYNHNARFIASRNAKQGNLKDNPIHMDMLFAAQQARLSFLLNVLIDKRKKVIAAVAGHCEKAHRQGCMLCKKLASVQAVVSDIVITSNGGYPLDQNVYQSVKGMATAESCVRSGGAIIICAALGDGHGGEAFYRWFSERPDAAAVMNSIMAIPPENTLMDQWEAQILARVQMKACCWFVTGKENRELIESMHMHWSPDADSALHEAINACGKNATVTVIPDGVGVIVE